MAASTELLLADVVKALETLTSEETKDLIIRFGVPLKVFIDIENECKMSSSRKSHAIQAWLNRDTGASWEKMISGLNDLGMIVLARKLATQHCPQSSYPASGPSQPASVHTTQQVTTHAPVTPAMPSSAAPEDQCTTSDHTQPVALNMRSVANVKATIRRLEKAFSGLTTRTRLSLCEKESQDKVFLDEFRDHLLNLPVAKKAAHVKFFRDSEDDILEARNIRKIFAILSRYWSYRNYEILLKIIDSFCDDLQASMKEYCRMLEEFEKTTTVDIYLIAVPDETDNDVESAFSKMVMKVDKPASECTLYELRKLNGAIIKGSSLCFHSVYISSVADKCVEVVVRFPPCAVGWVLSAITPAFIHTHLLTEVAVDEEQLTIFEADSAELEQYMYTDVDPPADYREMTLQDRYKWILNDQLMAASRTGDVVRVVSLLNSGADIHTVDSELSATALENASEHGHLQVVRLLLGRGSEVECRDEGGWTPLITAVWKDKCDVVIDLLDSGADVNAQENGGYSALIWAAMKGQTEVVVELLEANADLDLQNEDGDSALMKAAHYGRTEIVSELVNAGALLDLQNMRGDSAVIQATVRYQSDVVRVLVGAGSDLNLQNEEGLTALMISVRSGSSDITDILLEGDHIDLDTLEDCGTYTHNAGRSALHFSAERGDMTASQSVLKAGANALLKDMQEWSDS